ncbi:hypothetical protein NDU88_003914 [Pleurodeles waltl]|uniref:Uncharacterized protein n=1 Tax=Pleurodeles waltl TaxID=8319 RepID=A0AAV7LTA2_PLEWA|nr:hypothetical protein NDU88_003914 [Pleurodeles waltl]
MLHNFPLRHSNPSVTEVPLQRGETQLKTKPLSSSPWAVWGENSPEMRSGSVVMTLKGRQSRVRQRKAEKENEGEKQTNNQPKQEEKPLQKPMRDPTRRSRKCVHRRRRDEEKKTRPDSGTEVSGDSHTAEQPCHVPGGTWLHNIRRVTTLKGRKSRVRRRKAEKENEDEKQTNNKPKREEKTPQKLTLEKMWDPTQRNQKRVHRSWRDEGEKRG